MAQTAQQLSDRLLQRIKDRQAVVGVVGLGYVGLPLVLEFVSKGFNVVGLDIDQRKVDALTSGKSYIEYIPASSIEQMLATGRFKATPNPASVKECDAVLLCLPTPLTKQREPDTSYIEKMAESMAPHMKEGTLVVLESTTYPGTTSDVMAPILEKGSGMRAGENFFVAYSPEREDPANKQFKTATIPKVVGADTDEARAAANALYAAVVEKTVPVSSTATAEATKLVENIFRCVNIAMVNELKMVFQRMGIDIWEVVGAASTKPFGYMPFYPGPGLGGHCIPIDPFYLTWKAREFDMPTKFIELAGEINTHMPYYVVNRTMEALNEAGKALRGSKVLLIGLAYKKDVDDLRESPTLKLIELLEERGAKTDYHDPHIPHMKETREYPHLAGRESVGLDKLENYDCVIISTDHSKVDYDLVARKGKVVIDSRNAMKNHHGKGAMIFKA
jgi:UDP-N-acetyl-D-glucosamine dehydrogenase